MIPLSFDESPSNEDKRECAALPRLSPGRSARRSSNRCLLGWIPEETFSIDTLMTAAKEHTQTAEYVFQILFVYDAITVMVNQRERLSELLDLRRLEE